MARLPSPGGDNGTWGIILNDYLSVSLDTDGAIKPNTIGSTQLINNAVTTTKIANQSVGLSKLAQEVVDEFTNVPGAGITVTLVPTALWPPAPDSDPLHWYVKVANA